MTHELQYTARGHVRAVVVNTSAQVITTSIVIEISLKRN